MPKNDWKKVLKYDPNGSLPEGVCKVEERAVLHSISREPEVLEQALWTYEEDWVPPSGIYDEEFTDKYTHVKGIQKKLEKGYTITAKDLNKDSVGALSTVIHYYIPVREEDFEGGQDEEQVEYSLRVLPILRDMEDKLGALWECYDKINRTSKRRRG